MPLILFILCLQLRAYVSLNWDVIDPQSNHMGWYWWSLAVTTLSWQWWTSLITRHHAVTVQVVVMGALLLLAAYLRGPSIIEAMVCGIAVVTSRRPWVLPILIPLTALNVFLP